MIVIIMKKLAPVYRMPWCAKTWGMPHATHFDTTKTAPTYPLKKNINSRSYQQFSINFMRQASMLVLIEIDRDRYR